MEKKDYAKVREAAWAKIDAKNALREKREDGTVREAVLHETTIDLLIAKPA